MPNYQFQLEQFEGPLDLLLNLIEDQKLEITKVSLAKVAEQFIEYVNNSPELKPEEMADFLVIASKLLYIKSKALLPGLDLVEEGEAGDLEKQLKIYKEYREASVKVREMLKKKRFSFSRAKPIQVFTAKFIPPLDLNLTAMADIFKKALLKLEPIVNLPQAMIKRTISLRDKIRHISDLILQKVTMNFKYLLGGSGDRTEIIVSFLAVLELVKQRTVDVDQTELFADISIKRVE